MAEQRGVDAVERALSLLDCFDGREGALTLAELARRTGLYKSTILRLAVSLERFGYMLRQDDGRYRLGPTTWRLGSVYRRSFELAEIVRPELRTLVEQTGETASFYVREGDSRVCLYRWEPARSIRHSIVEGARMPLDRGATGRVLLAWSDDGAELLGAGVRRETRDRGWALSMGERDPEVAAIAVPVLDAEGRIMGALSVSGLVTRFDAPRQAAILAALEASRSRLGAPPAPG